MNLCLSFRRAKRLDMDLGMARVSPRIPGDLATSEHGSMLTMLTRKKYDSCETARNFRRIMEDPGLC
jgi:hypothetical protein